MDYSYTFIIPHKNSPDLLLRLLNSIPKRDDIQVIVVDDNSDYEVVNFDAFPGLDMPNVEVIFNKEPRGAGYARNIGLRKALGKWLFFADADDYYLPTLNALLDKYKSVYDVDIVYFNCCGETPENNRCREFNEYVERFKSGDLSAENNIRFHWWTPWNKIVRRSLVVDYDLTFEEVMSGNDARFCLLASYYANKICVEPDFYYVSTVQEKSITGRKKSLEESLTNLSTMMRIWNFTVFAGSPAYLYYKNIMSLQVIVGITRQYGIKGMFKYILLFWKEKMTFRLYEEIRPKL